MILLSLVLTIFTVQANILPEVFYAPEDERQSFCASQEYQNEAFWRSLVNDKITALVKGQEEVVQNSYVSLSYLELFQRSSQHENSQFMGYVYANASHHLGRLVRFHKWPSEHPLKKADQSLIKGNALRLAVLAASSELSSRLMSHSLALYKELMWNLLAANLCGPDYSLEMVSDLNLKRAYATDSIEEFIRAYVTFEQTYLQKTMYNDWLIGPTAKARVLDEMRFISFNGNEHPSFKEWCMENKCGASSFDLNNRIIFDAYSILNEYHLTQGIRDILLQRIDEASIETTAQYFLSE